MLEQPTKRYTVTSKTKLPNGVILEYGHELAEAILILPDEQVPQERGGRCIP